MPLPAWIPMIFCALLVLAMCFAATGIGIICRRLRPTWLAIAASIVIGGGCGIALGLGLARFVIPAEAFRTIPRIAPYWALGLAVFFAIVGSSQAAAAARPGGLDRAGPGEEP